MEKIFIGLMSLALAMSLSFQAFAETKGIVVLVPGTWNSMIPGSSRVNPLSKVVEETPYFGSTILETIEQHNYDYFVIRTLNAFGDLYNNGDQTAYEIQTWYEKNFPKHDKPITLLAHSMGGAYALQALKKLGHLPIKNVVMVSSPLEGCALADAFLSGSLSKAFLSALSSVAGDSFDFRGLYQATTGEMKGFLKSVQLAEGVNYFTVSSVQHTPPTPFHMFMSEYLSPAFAMTSIFYRGDFDGIVSASSALGRSSGLVFKELPFQGRLDHAEQVLDERILGLFGASHIEFVKEEQAKFYSQILSALP